MLHFRKALSGMAAAMSALLLAACATTNEYSARDFLIPKTDAQIIILEPTADHALITAGGVREARADWTDTVKTNLKRSFEQEFKERGVDVAMQKPDDEIDGQLLMLSETVMVSALTYTGSTVTTGLPTKKDKFDWTLGSAVKPLKEKYDADYAMFVYSYGNYASGGNLTLQFALMILSQGQYIPSGGAKNTLISLVDLNDGDLVWIDQQPNRDIRDMSDANLAVSDLIDRIPLEGTKMGDAYQKARKAKVSAGQKPAPPATSAPEAGEAGS
jgi:hypothetical protein